MRSRRGSSAVFLMAIMAAVISIVLALIYGARAECVKSRVDGVVSLAGDSVLSEFNSQVQEEYGLFIIRGSDRELGRKLTGYIEHSLGGMKDVEVESVRVSGSMFSTVDIDLIKEQIMEYMKLAEAEDRLAILTGYAEEGTGGSEREARTLRHGPTAASLPSSAVPDKSLTSIAKSIAENVTEADRAFEKGTEKYLLNGYILGMFNNRSMQVNDEHFFRSEVEYILGGEMSDMKNEKRVEMALKAMRFPLNLAHIYADPVKRSQTLALAELMTPGAAAPATQAALASTWAYAEADNDVELLWQGYEVPLKKDATSWAIDLDSAVEGIFGGTVVPQTTKGYDYSEYLQILLFFRDDNIKVSRIMDLIQINMRMTHDGEFLMNEYATGIRVDVKVNGVSYGYEKRY